MLSLELITELLGEKRARSLLDHKYKCVDASQLHLPGSGFVDHVWDFCYRKVNNHD
ncbi:MAG: hypothetical protein IT422_03790 [Pirellulaceae bacterium]|nr:hypothetical protein [Pirellulaceae bacterium]